MAVVPGAAIVLQVGLRLAGSGHDAVVAPRQISHGLWDIWVERGPGLGEAPHVLQVGSGQTLHIREFGAKVLGQPTNDPTPPPINWLPLRDGLADGPVRSDELGIDGPKRLSGGAPDPVLELAEEVGLAGGEGEVAGVSHAFDPIDPGPPETAVFTGPPATEDPYGAGVPECTTRSCRETRIPRSWAAPNWFSFLAAARGGACCSLYLTSCTFASWFALVLQTCSTTVP